MKAISLCLTRSWSQFGLLLTTAIAVETSLLSWSSKMSIRENQSYSGQFQIQSVLFLPEPRRRISSEAIAILLAHFIPSFTPTFLYPLQYTYYWALCCWNAASCLFFFKLSKFIICYGVDSNVFLSVLSLIPSPPWTCLRTWESLNTHTAAAALAYLLVWGDRKPFLFEKAHWQLHGRPHLYQQAFCFCLVGLRNFSSKVVQWAGWTADAWVMSPCRSCKLHCPLVDDDLMFQKGIK